MKKFLSTILAFFIVWTIAFGVMLLVDCLTGRGDARSGYYLIIGFAGALAGWLGPKVSGFIKRKF